MDQPKYQHDCDRCVFLGGYNHDGKRYDLYCCPQRDPSVIARYGDDGPEYLSGIMSLLPELMEAKRRAKERGLISEEYLSEIERRYPSR